MIDHDHSHQVLEFFKEVSAQRTKSSLNLSEVTEMPINILQHLFFLYVSALLSLLLFLIFYSLLRSTPSSYILLFNFFLIFKYSRWMACVRAQEEGQGDDSSMNGQDKQSPYQSLPQSSYVYFMFRM